MSQIFAFPVIDGETNRFNTNFHVDGDKAEVTFVVANDESRQFLDNVLHKDTHSLGFHLGENKERTTLIHGLYADCDIKVKGIDSATDCYTEITLLITNK